MVGKIEPFGYPVGIALNNRLGFVRLLGNPSVVVPCIPADRAWNITAGWLAYPNVLEIGPTPCHDEELSRLLKVSGWGHIGASMTLIWLHCAWCAMPSCIR